MINFRGWTRVQCLMFVIMINDSTCWWMMDHAMTLKWDNANGSIVVSTFSIAELGIATAGHCCAAVRPCLISWMWRTTGKPPLVACWPLCNPVGQGQLNGFRPWNWIWGRRMMWNTTWRRCTSWWQMSSSKRGKEWTTIKTQQMRCLDKLASAECFWIFWPSFCEKVVYTQFCGRISLAEFPRKSRNHTQCTVDGSSQHISRSRCTIVHEHEHPTRDP